MIYCLNKINVEPRGKLQKTINIEKRFSQVLNTFSLKTDKQMPTIPNEKGSNS